MAGKTSRTDLPGYFKGLSDRLEYQVRTMTPVIVHSGEMGDNDHQWFAELLRQYLPHRYEVDTGFVVNCDSDKGSADFFSADCAPRTQDPYISNQMDILLLDVMHNAPFCSEKTFKVCPVEMVLGAVEVTRDLNKSKLESDVKKLAKIKELAEKKQYMNRRFSGDPEKRDLDDIYYQRPFTGVVGLGGNLSMQAIDEVVGDCESGRKPDAIFMLNTFLCYYRADGTMISLIEKDYLYHFISILRYRLDLHLCDSADLSAYLPPAMLSYVKKEATVAENAQVFKTPE
jgi:hypothetical protein